MGGRSRNDWKRDQERNESENEEKIKETLDNGCWIQKGLGFPFSFRPISALHKTKPRHSPRALREVEEKDGTGQSSPRKLKRRFPCSLSATFQLAASRTHHARATTQATPQRTLKQHRERGGKRKENKRKRVQCANRSPQRQVGNARTTCHCSAPCHKTAFRPCKALPNTTQRAKEREGGCRL